MRLANTVSTLRSVCVLTEMPSTRFSRSRAGHQVLPALFAGSSDFSKDGIVSAVQAVEPEGVIFFVEAFRAQQQMQVPEGTLNFDGSVVGGTRWNTGDRSREMAQVSARSEIRVRLRRRFALCLHNR